MLNIFWKIVRTTLSQCFFFWVVVSEALCSKINCFIWQRWPFRSMWSVGGIPSPSSSARAFWGDDWITERGCGRPSFASFVEKAFWNELWPLQVRVVHGHLVSSGCAGHKLLFERMNRYSPSNIGIEWGFHQQNYVAHQTWLGSPSHSKGWDVVWVFLKPTVKEVESVFSLKPVGILRKIRVWQLWHSKRFIISCKFP